MREGGGKRKLSGEGRDGDAGDTSNDEDDEDDDEEGSGGILLKRSRVEGDEEEEDEEEDEREEDGMGDVLDVDRESSRYTRVLEVVNKLGESEEGQSVGMDVILSRLNASTASSSGGKRASTYSSKELKLILTSMERENKIMFDDGEVYIL